MLRIFALFTFFVVCTLTVFGTHAHAASAQGTFRDLKFSMQLGRYTNGHEVEIFLIDAVSDLDGFESCTALVHTPYEPIPRSEFFGYYGHFVGQEVTLGRLKFLSNTPQSPNMNLCTFNTITLIE